MLNPVEDHLGAPVVSRGEGRPETRSRLADALDAIEGFPVLARAGALLEPGPEDDRVDGVIAAVEADPGLMIRVLRAATETLPGRREGPGSVPEAIEMIGPSLACVVAESAPTFDPLDPRAAEFIRFRLHALSVQRSADQIAKLTGFSERAELAVVALLHDLGHLAIAWLRPERRTGEDVITRSPQERLADEREDLRIDHVLLGGALTRRWRLPRRISAAIEGHHAADATGLAAHVALADEISHYGHGHAFGPSRIEAARIALGLAPEDVTTLLREFPGVARLGAPDVCPLSARELDVLRRLAAGEPYRGIADGMGLSPSTVRTHLHNIYRKMGIADRSLAIHNASKFGWI